MKWVRDFKRLGYGRPARTCRGPAQGDSRIVPTETLDMGGPAGIPTRASYDEPEERFG